MPELPEVQATVDYLKAKVAGSKIIAAHFSWPNSVVTHNYKELERLLLGKTISSVSRRAKYIIFNLTQNKKQSYLLLHLRMSGCVDVLKKEIGRDPYDRFWLELSNSRELRFNDVRKFGKVYFYEDLKVFETKIGIEPLTKNFNADWLENALKFKKSAIKPVLLDQSIIAGIGNIYADESLWRSSIHPKKPANSISRKKIALLADAIKETLMEAIALKGTDNGDQVVSGGLYSPRVYAKDGTPCLRCKSKIVKVFVAQRGTHYCPRCQRL